MDVQPIPKGDTRPRRNGKLIKWRKVRKQILARDGWCRCGRPVVHEGPLVVHHIRQRSVRPDLICEPSNLIALAWNCHQYVHDNPDWAKSVGLLADSWEPLEGGTA